MNTNNATLWKEIDQPEGNGLSPSQWSWLCDTNSLTHRLRNTLSEQIEFRLKSAGFGEISEEERLALDIKDNCKHWVREIEWWYLNKPVIAARVVIPAGSKNSHALSLYRAGNASIGDFLFKKGGYIRDKIRIAKLPPSHAYFKLAYSDAEPDVSHIWARQSIFNCQQENLLVSEVFLPTFFASCEP